MASTGQIKDGEWPVYLQNLLQSLTAAASRPGNQAQLTGPGIAGVGLVQSPAQSAQPRPSTSISVQHLQQQYGNILAGPQLSVTSSAATQSLAVLPQNPALSLKIISSKKKSEYAIQNLRLNARFSSLESLKEQVLSKCDGKASVDSGFGYIEPGHGVKGKQRWLMSDEDVVDMYTIHDGKKEILLWCYSQDGSKRPRSPDNADEGSTSQKRSRYNKQVDKMREVDEIEDDLRSKHEGKYSEEQIRMWAHLIQMNKHSSLEEPPNKKFWKTSGGTGCAGAAAGSGQGSSKGVLSSPGKRVNLRGQCIDQLHRLQQLYNDGGITEDQYLDMKESIMKEVKKFE